jgi:hypothetical protein
MCIKICALTLSETSCECCTILGNDLESHPLCLVCATMHTALMVILGNRILEQGIGECVKK